MRTSIANVWEAPESPLIMLDVVSLVIICYLLPVSESDSRDPCVSDCHDQLPQLKS